VSILLEHSSVLTPRFKSNRLRLGLGACTLIGIVLSNCYKGIVTTSTVKPFERVGISSLDEALHKNYSLLSETVLEGWRTYCCLQNGGLSHRVEFLKNSTKQFEFRDVLVAVNRDRFLYYAQNRARQAELQLELRQNFTLQGVAVSGNDTSKDRLLLKLINSMQPCQCGYKSHMDELFTCNNTPSIQVKDDALYFQKKQKFNNSRDVENPIYYTQQQAVLDSSLDGFYIYPLTIAREIIVKVLRAYDESGINENTMQIVRLIKLRQNFQQMRLLFGRLVDYTTLLQPMTMNTNVYCTFLLCLYFLLAALLYLSMEVTCDRIVVYSRKQAS